MSLLDVAKVAGYIGVTEATELTPQGLLQGVLDAAEAAVGRHLGLDALGPTSYTETACTTGRVIYLDRRPVISLTTVASAGTVVDLTGLVVDAEAGVVSTASGGRFAARAHTVTYQAGWTTPLPADLEVAVKEMVRHLWRPQRGGGSRGQAPAPADQPVGYLFPNVVAGLLAPFEPGPGFS